MNMVQEIVAGRLRAFRSGVGVGGGGRGSDLDGAGRRPAAESGQQLRRRRVVVVVAGTGQQEGGRRRPSSREDRAVAGTAGPCRAQPSAGPDCTPTEADWG